MIASLTGIFGAIGLVLAAVGLYGVTAYSVEQRTSEIGVRMALGAPRAAVMTMVMRGPFWQLGIGLALGVAASIAVIIPARRATKVDPIVALRHE